MSNTETEYGYAYEPDDGFDVEIEVRVRYNPDRVKISPEELDAAANDAVEYVRVRAVQAEHNED